MKRKERKKILKKLDEMEKKANELIQYVSSNDQIDSVLKFLNEIRLQRIKTLNDYKGNNRR